VGLFDVYHLDVGENPPQLSLLAYQKALPFDKR
jgi:hypothetical protein